MRVPRGTGWTRADAPYPPSPALTLASFPHCGRSSSSSSTRTVSDREPFTRDLLFKYRACAQQQQRCTRARMRQLWDLQATETLNRPARTPLVLLLPLTACTPADHGLRRCAATCGASTRESMMPSAFSRCVCVCVCVSVCVSVCVVCVCCVCVCVCVCICVCVSQGASTSQT